jgi:type II secretory pathway predicted ATPase ExeA
MRAHFNLTRAPFSPEIEHHALFSFDSYKQCHARLDFVRRERGCCALHGEFGSGKSSCVRGFIGQLALSSYLVLYAAVPNVGAPLRPIVEGWLEELGEKIPFNNLAACLRLLQRALEAIYEKGRLPFIVLDEAHQLDNRSLLQLKPLLNYDMDSRLPLAMVLAGGPPLARHLAFHGLQELRQRLLFIYPFQGLARAELQPYLEARLRHAGCDRVLFPPDIVDELYCHTQGLPRLVNQLANLSLLAASTAGKHLVDSSCLRQALAEMGLGEDNRREPLPTTGRK